MFFEYLKFLRMLEIDIPDIDLLSSENFREYMKFLYDRINKRNKNI